MNILLKFYTPFDRANEQVKAIEHLEKAFGIAIDHEIQSDGELLPNSKLIPLKEKYFSSTKQEVIEDVKLYTVDQSLHKKLLLSRYLLEKGFQYADTKLWYILIELDISYVDEKFFSLFNDLALNLNAYWAKAIPKEAEADINMQHMSDLPEILNKYNLPQLGSPKDFKSPTHPANLGWINFWNAEYIKLTGINSTQNRVNFNKYVDNSDGSFSFMITEKPLNLEKTDHLDTVRELYEKYPIIGNRMK